MSEFQVRLDRDALNTPWGFRLQGGKDFNAPLTVQRVSTHTTLSHYRVQGVGTHTTLSPYRVQRVSTHTTLSPYRVQRVGTHTTLSPYRVQRVSTHTTLSPYRVQRVSTHTTLSHYRVQKSLREVNTLLHTITLWSTEGECTLYSIVYILSTRTIVCVDSTEYRV